jgi:uroporphyrinogen-III synthase
VAEESHAEGFARAIEGRIGEGDRVLLVRPEVARAILAEALRDRGASVDAVPFYRNVPAADVRQTARRIMEGRFDAVIFTSPSTLTRLLDAGPGEGFGICDALDRLAIVAIGEVTASALRRNALRPGVVAAQPSDEALIEAVRALFAE